MIHVCWWVVVVVAVNLTVLSSVDTNVEWKFSAMWFQKWWKHISSTPKSYPRLNLKRNSPVQTPKLRVHSLSSTSANPTLPVSAQSKRRLTGITYYLTQRVIKLLLPLAISCPISSHVMCRPLLLICVLTQLDFPLISITTPTWSMDCIRSFGLWTPL